MTRKNSIWHAVTRSGSGRDASVGFSMQLTNLKRSGNLCIFEKLKPQDLQHVNNVRLIRKLPLSLIRLVQSIHQREQRSTQMSLLLVLYVDSVMIQGLPESYSPLLSHTHKNQGLCKYASTVNSSCFSKPEEKENSFFSFSPSLKNGQHKIRKELGFLKTLPSLYITFLIKPQSQSNSDCRLRVLIKNAPNRSWPNK